MPKKSLQTAGSSPAGTSTSEVSRGIGNAIAGASAGAVVGGLGGIPGAAAGAVVGALLNVAVGLHAQRNSATSAKSRDSEATVR